MLREDAVSADPTPSVPEIMSEAVRAFLEQERTAREECDIHVTVGGKTTPLRDCDWVLRRPCGHAVSIMSAVQIDDVYPNAASAWPEMYSDEPSPYVRERDREIRAMQKAGWTLEALRTDDAVKAHRDSFRFCKEGCGELPKPPTYPAYTATSNPDLGARRVRVMRGLAKGLAVKQIARRMGLTYDQVKADLAAMYRHAEVSTRRELVISALTSGELESRYADEKMFRGVLTPETESDTMESFS